jgi:hypothetical protein
VHSLLAAFSGLRRQAVFLYMEMLDTPATVIARAMHQGTTPRTDVTGCDGQASCKCGTMLQLSSPDLASAHLCRCCLHDIVMYAAMLALLRAE